MSRRSIDIRIERPVGLRPPSAAVSSGPDPEQDDGTQALQARQRIRSVARLGAALATWATLWPSSVPLTAQEPLAPDTYRDEATRTLVERAVAARLRTGLGIRSYEATLRQRMYVGITAFAFRRERGLFEQERIARIRWTADGEQAIQWIGARAAVPIVGLDSGGDRDPPDRTGVPDGGSVDGAGQATRDEIREELRREFEEDDELDVTAEDYLEETDFPGFDFDPASDRLRFGDDWAFHPLADTALVNYRYALGDTLRIELPANDLSVVLYEVRVEPRRADFDLLAASLWLDSASAQLVRGTYRPARPWSMRVDEPQAAANVPGFVGPIEAEITHITVESTLQELEYWLPRRFAFQGEGRAGGLLRMPITLEWSVGGYIVNEPPFDILVEGELPEGWQREVRVEEDDEGNEITYTVIVPTTEELRRSLALSEDFGRRTPVNFSDDELSRLAERLGGLVPAYRPFPPHVAWGLEDGQLRFNRVEGLSAGLSTSIALDSRLYLDLSGRFGVADREPNAAVALRSGPETSEWVLEGYHRLTSMNQRDDPFTLANSLKNIGLGIDRGEYFRATGVALAHRRRGPSTRFELRLFHQRERAIEGNSDFSVRGLWRDGLAYPTLAAREVDVSGARVLFGWFVGTDPSGWIVTGEVTGEGGVGEAGYQRADLRLSVSHPLFRGLTGGVEAGAGTSWSDVPVQRSFFLGGSRSLRGFHVNELHGPTYWRSRAELATVFAGARLGLFTDMGWVGERSGFRLDDPFAAVGMGASLLDGLVRFDVARAVRGAERWRLHLYLDGLF